MFLNDIPCSPAVPNSSPRIFSIFRLVNTPESDNQLVRRELRALTVFRLICSLHSVLCSQGLELGTADVVMRVCVQGAWLWTAIAGRVGSSLSVLSG